MREYDLLTIRLFRLVSEGSKLRVTLRRNSLDRNIEIADHLQGMSVELLEVGLEQAKFGRNYCRLRRNLKDDLVRQVECKGRGLLQRRVNEQRVLSSG